MKAVNTKGQSNYSNELSVTTKVDKISPPEHATYNPSSTHISFSVEATCLPLVGVIEGQTGPDAWQVRTKHELVLHTFMIKNANSVRKVH